MDLSALRLVSCLDAKPREAGVMGCAGSAPRRSDVAPTRGVSDSRARLPRRVRAAVRSLHSVLPLANGGADRGSSIAGLRPLRLDGAHLVVARGSVADGASVDRSAIQILTEGDRKSDTPDEEEHGIPRAVPSHGGQHNRKDDSDPGPSPARNFGLQRTHRTIMSRRYSVSGSAAESEVAGMPMIVHPGTVETRGNHSCD